ncbi:MAG: hypothetical protein GY898_06585 [Proteobacteria bacterium]|nr:hypothetical protein [Pseudomonadota bacterium]
MRAGLSLAFFLLAMPLASAQVDDLDLDDVDLDEYEDDRAESDLRLPEEITEEDLVQTVLVVPLKGETAESTGVGVLLEGFLRGSLEDQDRFTVVGLEECPQVEDIDAELYYEGCPAGDELGCQFVIGEVADVDRVISGRVTVRSEGRYRIIVTILNVAHADLEFEYALDLAEGEEDLLPRTVELALDRLRREELLSPYRDALEADQDRREAVEAAQTEEERRLVARMEFDDLRGDELERAAADAKPVDRGITEEEMEEIKSSEGVAREWDDMGISERQYFSYKNSGLEFDKWKWRWSGHRLQLLASVYVGFIGGSTGLKYYGGYLLDPGLQSTVDSYSWQRVDQGQSFTIGFSGGIGLLRNLDIEAGAWWSRSNVSVRLFSGDTQCPTPGDLACPVDQLSPSDDNHPPGPWADKQVDLFGGEVMLRFFVLTMPIVRPTIGAGLQWILYPSLYNDPDVPDPQEQPEPAVADSFQTFSRLIDFGLQLEPGVQIDIGKHLGIFVRVPIGIGMNPARKQQTAEAPSIISNADEVGNVPFGTVRVVIGVQGRLLGLPVQPKTGGADDVLDEDE